MNSLLYPFGKEKIGTINNTLHDLQIDAIVRYVYVDKGKQEKILSILQDILLDEETIKFRQSVLRDMMFNRNIYYGLSKQSQELDKCYADYNASRSARAKIKVKSEMELSETTMMLKDYAHDILKLLEIYKRLYELFRNHGPSSVGLKDLAKKVSDKINNPYCQAIINNQLPLTIGGGIGQSRLCMYYLQKKHIGEVQSSYWDDKNKELAAKNRIKLL